MKTAINLSLLLLTSCNQWIRSNPPPAASRDVAEQHDLAVKVESSCDPFDDAFGFGSTTSAASGVIVSDWQVLTALHAVDCPSAIAVIHVTTSKGRWRFSPEKEWRDADVARIQMSSADSLHVSVHPPTLRDSPMDSWEPVFIQAAHPVWEEIIGESMGGAEYGGERYVAYNADTARGNSGAGVYDISGNLIGIHVRHSAVSRMGYASPVVSEMIPH